MFKLKKILLEVYSLDDNDYRLNLSNGGIFVIGPDAKVWGMNDRDFHGHTLFEYPNELELYKKDSGYTGDIANRKVELDAEKGTDGIYTWMYDNKFIRGGNGWITFKTITDKQKDVLINIIENNKNKFDMISVDIIGNAFMKIPLKDFWRKYLV